MIPASVVLSLGDKSCTHNIVLDQEDTMHNVSHHVARHLSHLSGFVLTSDLGKYLGVPLLHGRKKISHYKYLLDKTQQKSKCLEG